MKDEVEKLYLSGYSITDISNELNVTRGQIIKIVRDEKLVKKYLSIHGGSRVRTRHKIKQLAILYKGGCCEICGYNKYIGALDFHHIDGKEKEFTIAGAKGKSWLEIKEEIKKCMLLCSNCHREIHAGLIDLN